MKLMVSGFCSQATRGYFEACQSAVVGNPKIPQQGGASCSGRGIDSFAPALCLGDTSSLCNVQHPFAETQLIILVNPFWTSWRKNLCPILWMLYRSHLLNQLCPCSIPVWTVAISLTSLWHSIPNPDIPFEHIEFIPIVIAMPLNIHIIPH